MDTKKPDTNIANEDQIVHTIEKEDLEKATMSRSRLKETQTSKTKRNFILSIVGIICLFAFMLTIGPQLLVQFSIFVGNMKSDEAIEADKKKVASYIAPPYLKQPEKATKEKSITITGEAEGRQTIELYVNDSLAEKKSVNGGTFTFSGVTLHEGENLIQAKSVVEKNESNFSESVKVTYREKPPEIEIETPKDGDAFSGSVSILKVKGKTAPHAKVTINDAWAIMDDTGEFRYDFRMQSGENKVMVKATDEVGNKTEKEVKFTYSP